MEQTKLRKVLKSGITVVQVPDGVNFGTEDNPQIATVLFGIAGIGNEHLEMIQKSQFSVLMLIMLSNWQMRNQKTRLFDY